MTNNAHANRVGERVDAQWNIIATIAQQAKYEREKVGHDYHRISKRTARDKSGAYTPSNFPRFEDCLTYDEQRHSKAEECFFKGVSK